MLLTRLHSPEDQAILEEEFQKDSKPDKNARKRIVERVALGEKEVQVCIPYPITLLSATLGLQ